MEREELLKRYRYVLNENRHIADLKQQIVEKEKEYVSAQNKEVEAKEKMGNGTFAKCAVPMILAFLAALLAVICLFDKDMRIFTLFLLAASVFFYGIATLIMKVSFAKHDRDKNMIEAARIHNEELIPVYQQYEQKISQLNNVLATSQIGVFENQIPERYRTEDAVTFFVDALENRRADTEKEMFNIYEEELHRRKMEQMETERLQKLDASLVHCPKCGGTHCRMTTQTKTDVTPFGIGDACCGFILLGPIGILCGLCGTGSSTETKTVWICDDCGKKFSD